MLRTYLTSVLIYMIIIYCETKIFKNNIIKNGWITTSSTKEEKNNSVLNTLFCYAAVPVARVLLIIALFVMFTYSKEKVDTWMSENK